MAIHATSSQRLIANHDVPVGLPVGAVACAALKLAVDLIQGESGVALVVKRQRLEVVFFVVAVSTSNLGWRTELVAVRLRVTILAIASRGHSERTTAFVRLLARGMTGITSKLAVGAFQLETRRSSVVESRHLDPVETVGGMARGAIRGRPLGIRRIELTKRSLMDVGVAGITSGRGSQEPVR